MAVVPDAGNVLAKVDFPLGAPSQMQNAFHPNGLPSLILTTVAGSVNGQLPRTNRGDENIRVYNPNSRIVRMKLGLDNSVVATAQDKAIAPGTVETFTISPRVQWVAVFDTAAGTLEVSCGRGA